MKNITPLFLWSGLVTFLLFGNTNMYSQEWQAWSEWEKSSLEEELSHRQRIKYTTSDTYAVQIEWKNRSAFNVKIKFEVRDRRNIKEVKIIKIPREATRAMYAGTSFKNNRIRVRLLKHERLKE